MSRNQDRNSFFLCKVCSSPPPDFQVVEQDDHYACECKACGTVSREPFRQEREVAQ